MVAIAHFVGGPHDGATREIDAPFPLVLTVCIDGVLADYHYHGFKDGSANYGIESVDSMHSRCAA